MSVKFPTEITAEPALVELYKSRPWPIPRKVQGGLGTGYGNGYYYTMHTDTDGMLAAMAVDAHRQMTYASRVWTGTASVADALTLAVRGWQEPVADVLSQARAIHVGKLRSLIPTLEYADEPGEPDVATYLAGESDCFLMPSDSAHAAPAGTGAVRIVMEPVVSAGVAESDILSRGALILALMWALEQAGVKVSIEFSSAISCSTHQNQLLLHAEVKPYGVPPDVSRLMFWLAHPSASRRALFACLSLVCGGEEVSWWHRSTCLPIEQRPVADEPNVICVPEVYVGDVMTEWTAKLFAKAGVEVIE